MYDEKPEEIFIQVFEISKNVYQLNMVFVNLATI